MENQVTLNTPLADKLTAALIQATAVKNNGADLAMVEDPIEDSERSTTVAQPTGAPKNGLFAAFTKVVFQVVDRETYDREDRNHKITAKSRKVADVLVEVGIDTGFYLKGTISIVQPTGAKKGGLAWGWRGYNPETKQRAVECNGPAATKRETEWKQATITAFQSFCRENGIDLTKPVEAPGVPNEIDVSLV